MAADQLDLGVGQSLLGQVAQDLVPEKMRVKVLLDTGLRLELSDQLLDATGRVGAAAIALEEIRLFRVCLHVGRQGQTKSLWHQNIPIFVPLAPVNEDLALIGEHVHHADGDELADPETTVQQQPKHQLVGDVAAIIDGLEEITEFPFCQENRQLLPLLWWLQTELSTDDFADIRELLIAQPLVTDNPLDPFRDPGQITRFRSFAFGNEKRGVLTQFRWDLDRFGHLLVSEFRSLAIIRNHRLLGCFLCGLTMEL
jgi:hypothetical protein